MKKINFDVISEIIVEFVTNCVMLMIAQMVGVILYVKFIGASTDVLDNNAFLSQLLVSSLTFSVIGLLSDWFRKVLDRPGKTPTPTQTETSTP